MDSAEPGTDEAPPPEKEPDPSTPKEHPGTPVALALSQLFLEASEGRRAAPASPDHIHQRSLQEAHLLNSIFEAARTDPDSPWFVAPSEPSWLHLWDQVETRPLDGPANYALAIALTEEAPEFAVRHLDRAFRIDPTLIVPFLQDPEAQGLRSKPPVDQLLRSRHKDLQRRIWAGYA